MAPFSRCPKCSKDSLYPVANRKRKKDDNDITKESTLELCKRKNNCRELSIILYEGIKCSNDDFSISKTQSGQARKRKPKDKNFTPRKKPGRIVVTEYAKRQEEILDCFELGGVDRRDVTLFCYFRRYDEADFLKDVDERIEKIKSKFNLSDEDAKGTFKYFQEIRRERRETAAARTSAKGRKAPNFLRSLNILRSKIDDKVSGEDPLKKIHSKKTDPLKNCPVIEDFYLFLQKHTYREVPLMTSLHGNNKARLKERNRTLEEIKSAGMANTESTVPNGDCKKGREKSDSIPYITPDAHTNNEDAARDENFEILGGVCGDNGNYVSVKNQRETDLSDNNQCLGESSDSTPSITQPTHNNNKDAARAHSLKSYSFVSHEGDGCKSGDNGNSENVSVKDQRETELSDNSECLSESRDSTPSLQSFTFIQLLHFLVSQEGDGCKSGGEYGNSEKTVFDDFAELKKTLDDVLSNPTPQRKKTTDFEGPDGEFAKLLQESAGEKKEAASDAGSVTPNSPQSSNSDDGVVTPNYRSIPRQR